jgi:multisubunit Na+/H+ antiporter MnhG subunit
METDETPERGTTTGYFITIFAVLGGAFLIASSPVFFTTIAPLVLLILTPVLLIGSAKYRERKRLLAKRSATIDHSQEPVVVSQSSTSSDICESAPWR